MKSLIPKESIRSKIYSIREHRVMLDRDLAQMYGVGTRDLNKAVTRNSDRFPADFMFELTQEEFHNLMFQFGTSSWGGTRKRPRVFTEHGILMLSSVLKSKRAVQANIQIMRTFTKIREMLETHKDLKLKIENMEKKYDKQFQIVFEAIKQLLASPAKPKRRIGFHKLELK